MTRSIALAATAACLLWLVPGTALAGDSAAGEAKFMLFCATCHGNTGKGDGPGGAGLQPPPRDFTKGDFKFDANGNGTTGEDEDLKMVISKGAAAFKDADGNPGSALMTPWLGALTETDIENIIAFIRTKKE